MNEKLLTFIDKYSKLIKIIEIPSFPNSKYQIDIDYSSMYFLIKNVYPDEIKYQINLDFLNKLVYSNLQYHLEKKLIFIDENQHPKVCDATVFLYKTLYKKFHQQ